MKDIVVGIGEILWDMLSDGKKPGGAPANFAYHVSQFGLPAVVCSAVGPDDAGRELITLFDSRNLPHLTPTVDYPTGSVEVEIDADGIPQYDIKREVAWDHIPLSHELEKLASRTRAMSFGSLAQRCAQSRHTIQSFAHAVSAGLPKDHPDSPLIVFDVNLRQDFYDKDLLHQSLELCNVLKINDEELVIVSRLFDYPGLDLESKCRALLADFNLRIVILTCGTNGSYVFTPGEKSFFPTPRVEVADTVGAGDSFTAAFVASVLRGRTVREAHAKAVETAAFVCTQPGAMPVLPHTLKD